MDEYLIKNNDFLHKKKTKHKLKTRPENGIPFTNGDVQGKQYKKKKSKHAKGDENLNSFSSVNEISNTLGITSGEEWDVIETKKHKKKRKLVNEQNVDIKHSEHNSNNEDVSCCDKDQENTKKKKRVKENENCNSFSSENDALKEHTFDINIKKHKKKHLIDRESEVDNDSDMSRPFSRNSSRNDSFSHSDKDQVKKKVKLERKSESDSFSLENGTLKERITFDIPIKKKKKKKHLIDRESEVDNDSDVSRAFSRNSSRNDSFSHSDKDQQKVKIETKNESDSFSLVNGMLKEHTTFDIPIKKKKKRKHLIDRESEVDNDSDKDQGKKKVKLEKKSESDSFSSENNMLETQDSIKIKKHKKKQKYIDIDQCHENTTISLSDSCRNGNDQDQTNMSTKDLSKKTKKQERHSDDKQHATIEEHKNLGCTTDTDRTPIPPKKIKTEGSPVRKSKEDKKQNESAIENLTTYEYVQDYLDMSAIRQRLSEDHKMMLKQLHISVPWNIPATHLIETRMSSHPTKEQKQQFKDAGFQMKTTHYSPIEDKIILENWEYFCKVHNLPVDPEPFLSFEANNDTKQEGSALPKLERINFVRFLGHKLEHRYLFSIYRRFKKLLETVKKGRFTELEDKIILDYVQNSNDTNPFSKLSLVLNRDRHRILMRFKTLKEK